MTPLAKEEVATILDMASRLAIADMQANTSMTQEEAAAFATSLNVPGDAAITSSNLQHLIDQGPEKVLHYVTLATGGNILRARMAMWHIKNASRG